MDPRQSNPRTVFDNLITESFLENNSNSCFCKISDNGTRALAEALKVNFSLESADLSIRDIRTRFIADAFKFNQFLKSMDSSAKKNWAYWSWIHSWCAQI